MINDNNEKVIELLSFLPDKPEEVNIEDVLMLGCDDIQQFEHRINNLEKGYIYRLYVKGQYVWLKPW